MNKELIVKEEEVGKEFLLELEKLITIRKNKRLIYQDQYLEDIPLFLLMQIENKIKRIKSHINNNTINNDIEKCEDNCLDCAIYSIFLSIVLNNKNEK